MTQPKIPTPVKNDKKARLEGALRANLQRRKAAVPPKGKGKPCPSS